MDKLKTDDTDPDKLSPSTDEIVDIGTIILAYK